MQTETLRQFVRDALGTGVVEMTSLRGGDVADAYRVTLAGGTCVFAKTHAAPPPNFFSTEAAGLRWLRDANALPVAEVIAVADDPAFLVLEWIEERAGLPEDEAAFGRDLAALHQAGAATFGREDRRTTGSRGLPNQACPTWAEFFASQRLAPIAQLIGEPFASRLDAVADRIEERAGPSEPVARLHGDLWAGNRLVDTHGASWLIDPACFGGHREFDLAMMRLFGGFADAAFCAYAEVFPLADGWQSRVALYQLAPLGIHAVKFGSGYFGRLDDALRSVGC
ncbi:MAG: fructosamine kinase family protein [Acidimicrobiales bacterium]|nr:fructosamine kinase family protein [Acidimicrobiales bacterium]